MLSSLSSLVFLLSSLYAFIIHHDYKKSIHFLFFSHFAHCDFTFYIKIVNNIKYAFISYTIAIVYYVGDMVSSIAAHQGAISPYASVVLPLVATIALAGVISLLGKKI